MLQNDKREISRQEGRYKQQIKLWIREVMRKPLTNTSVYITEHVEINAAGMLIMETKISILDKDLPVPVTIITLPRSIEEVEQKDIWRMEKRLYPYKRNKPW